MKTINNILEKNHMLLLFMIISTLLISGCSGPVSNNTNSKIITGYDGLVLQFMKGNTEEVFEGDTFAISYYITNAGTTDVNDGRMAFPSGNNFVVTNKESISRISVTGKSFAYPYPGEEYYEAIFTTKSNLLNKLDYLKDNIKFNLCYAYTTSFATTVCIDTRISTQDQRTPACTSKTVSGGAGQGAPISVTQVVPEMRVASANNIRPQFKIYVANKGKGRAIHPTTNNQNPCDPAVNSDLDTISIKAYLSDQVLTCSPEKMRLGSADTYFRCYVSDNDVANFPKTTLNYIAPLRIELSYSYTESFSYPITIKRSLNPEDDTILQDATDDGCGTYQAKNDDNTCEDLCTFCVNNKAHAKCKDLEGIGILTSAYSCTCNIDKCKELDDTDNCIYNFCKGSSYCCRDPQCVGQNSDGEPCNDNHACKDGKCTPTTLCEYYEGNQGNQGKSCNMLSNCDMATVENGLCPSNGVVCCKKATQNCDTKYQVEYKGECMDLCKYCATSEGRLDTNKCAKLIRRLSFFDSSFSCSCSKTDCDINSKNGLCYNDKGFCDNTKYCCISPDDFCKHHADGTPCDKNYVCISGTCRNKQAYTDECAQYAGESSMNYKCFINSELCQDGTIYEGTSNTYLGACATDNYVCCIENTCLNKVDGTACGENNEFVCIGNKCTSLKPCSAYTGATCTNNINNNPTCDANLLLAYCPSGKTCCPSS